MIFMKEPQYIIKAGFVWRKNELTVHLDGSRTQGGYVTLRPAKLLETFLYRSMEIEPTP